MCLTLASDIRTIVQVVGDVTLNLDDNCLPVLKDCLYVPE